MFNKILRLTIVMVFTVTGLLVARFAQSYVFSLLKWRLEDFGTVGAMVATGAILLVGVLIFGGLGYALSGSIVRATMRLSERLVRMLTRLPAEEIASGAMGAVVGLVIASLLGISFSGLPYVGPYIPVGLSIICTIVGVKVALSKSADVYGLVGRFFNLKPQEVPEVQTQEVLSGAKILDTSVLIDGRIVDVVRTGFLEGPLLLPNFVLKELQLIADSADSLKRNRGRRGLDIVKELRDGGRISVELTDRDYPEVAEVDSKLLLLAQEIGGKIVTNDFNLNKVADIQGVAVLNFNELANALKPAVLPGEHMNVFVAKEGKEHGQGIAYLADGTMVVVENGRRSLNASTNVVVTSVLQTAAGRMIFARAK